MLGSLYLSAPQRQATGQQEAAGAAQQQRGLPPRSWFLVVFGTDLEEAVWDAASRLLRTPRRSRMLEPILLPDSQGRQNMRAAFAIGSQGRLACVWAAGNRFASVNRKYSVHVGELPPITGPAAEPAWEAAPAQAPSGAPEQVSEPFAVDHQGKQYHVYFGDLHRHTNISRCSPTIDGSLTDAHRYALDAVQYDGRGGRWRT